MRQERQNFTCKDQAGMWSDAWFVVPTAVWSLLSILVMFCFVIRVELVQTADNILSLCLPCSASLYVFEGWSERCGSGKLFTLTSCYMKLMALLFGEHDEAMDSHIVTSVVRQRIAFSKRIWRLESIVIHFVSGVVVGQYFADCGWLCKNVESVCLVPRDRPKWKHLDRIRVVG